MESISKAVLVNKIWQPLFQTVRYRRVNVKHPRPPHYERARLEVLAKPVYAPPLEKFLPLSAKCKKEEENKILKFKVDNPFETFLVKDCNRLFHESALVAICHRNPMKAEDKFNMSIRFKRDKMLIKEYGRRIVEQATKDTKFTPILDLYTVHQFTIFCPEPNVKALLKNIKKTPQLILLAAIVDGYYADVNQLKEYARLDGNITQARAEFVSILNSAGQSVVSSLNQHQTILVSNLDQYAEILKSGIASESKETVPPESKPNEQLEASGSEPQT